MNALSTRFLAAASAAACLALAATAQWGPVITTAAPAPGSGALMGFDAPGNRMLLFGGNGTNEFWSYSAGNWTQLTPSVVPAPRSRANLAVDSLSGSIVLYGGLGGAQFALDETWQWNGTAWQQLAPAVSPGGLYRHGMAYDVARNATVVFGGRYNSWLQNQALGNTWEFDGSTWTQVIPVQSPPGRTDMAMAYHPALPGILLFGGRDGTGAALDDTWAYDGTTWTQINTTGVRPPARVGGKLVPVLGRNLCVLFGGRDPVTMVIFNDTWEHNGTSWVQIANVYGGIYPPRDEFGIAHDFGRDRLVAFGGVTANGSLRDDTWEYGAQFQPYGAGCAGSAGVPTLTGGVLPILGQVTTATLGQLPPASPFAFMAVGTSRTQWALGNLPMSLASVGMPNCLTYTSADLLVFVPAAGGSGSWSFAVPLQASLVGAAYYLQGVSWDPGINPLGLAMSNAATLVVGN